MCAIGRYAPLDVTARQQPKEQLRIMIVYEDLLTCRVAERVFDQITARMASDCEIYLTLRSFVVLAIPTLVEQAVSDAAAADLILLSVHGQGNWPPPVERWMELLVSERAARHGGLAAVLVRPQAAASAARERCAALEQLAQLSGRDFFFAKDVDWVP